MLCKNCGKKIELSALRMYAVSTPGVSPQTAYLSANASCEHINIAYVKIVYKDTDDIAYVKIVRHEIPTLSKI